MVSREEIESDVLDALVDLGAKDASEFYEESGTIEDIDMVNDLGLNGVDFIELTMALEEALNVELDAESVGSCGLVSELIDYIEPLLQ